MKVEEKMEEIRQLEKKLLALQEEVENKSLMCLQPFSLIVIIFCPFSLSLSFPRSFSLLLCLLSSVSVTMSLSANMSVFQSICPSSRQNDNRDASLASS